MEQLGRKIGLHTGDLERNARVLISEFHELRVCEIAAINSGVTGGIKLEL